MEGLLAVEARRGDGFPIIRNTDGEVEKDRT
jgi:hypothetical protein